MQQKHFSRSPGVKRFFIFAGAYRVKPGMLPEYPVAGNSLHETT
jgi:hypothetical protein